MDGDPPVSELVLAARAGQQEAWNGLVERYTPLVLSVVRRHRLQGSDTEDVMQTLWLRLVEHLGEIREPEALPGWIATTTRNECMRLIRARQRTRPFDPMEASPLDVGADPGSTDNTPLDDAVLERLAQTERHEVLLSAFAELSDQHRELLLLLVADPPLSYTEISSRLSIPIGSIGPTRARALQRIRQSPAVAAAMSGRTREVNRPRRQ
jgi:RNA polymerase sigma factor (sigma-70 family)